MKKILLFFIVYFLFCENAKSQDFTKSYEEWIVTINKLYEETLKNFTLTTNTKSKIKNDAINRFKNSYTISKYNKKIKATDDNITTPIKESIIMFNDPSKFNWYIEKEGELYRSIKEYINTLGLTDKKIDDVCDCLVSKIIEKYPKADYLNYGEEGIRYFYEVSKECAKEHVDYKKLDNNLISWNEISRSGITESLLKRYKKELSGIYTNNELLNLVQWQVNSLEKDYPNGLRLHDIGTDYMRDFLQKEYIKWQKINNKK